MDPALEEYLRRQQVQQNPSAAPPPFLGPGSETDSGPSPVQAMRPQPPAPPMAPAPPAQPAPAPSAGMGMDPSVLKHLTGLLGPEFDPKRFQDAQEADWWKTKRNELNNAGGQIAAAMGNVPFTPQDPTSRVNQTMLADRRTNLLGTTEAAGKLQGMLLQQSLMDPNSPMSRAKQQQILTTDPDYVAKRYGGPEGLRNVPGFLIDQDMATREKLVGVQKTGAETDKLHTDVWAAQQSASARLRELDQAKDLKLRELDQARSEGNLNRVNEINKQILALQTERDKFNLENPRAISPDLVFVGTGAPPKELRTAFITNVWDPTKAAIASVDRVVALQKDLEAKGGLARFDPREVQPLLSEYAKLRSELARKAAAGNSPADSEIKIAVEQLPEPSAIKDSLMFKRAMGGAAQIKHSMQADLLEQLRSHGLANIPTGTTQQDAERAANPAMSRPAGTIKVRGPDGATYYAPAGKAGELPPGYTAVVE